MRNALIATAALIGGACVALAVFTLANAIADHSWIVAVMMAGVVVGFIWFVSAPAPAATQSPLGSGEPSGLGEAE